MNLASRVSFTKVAILLFCTTLHTGHS